MSCSINKPMYHMFFTCKNFVFRFYAEKRFLLPEMVGGGGGGSHPPPWIPFLYGPKFIFCQIIVCSLHNWIKLACFLLIFITCYKAYKISPFIFISPWQSESWVRPDSLKVKLWMRQIDKKILTQGICTGKLLSILSSVIPRVVNFTLFASEL